MSTKVNISKRPTGITTTLLWKGNTTSSSDIVEDTTWISTFNSNTEPTQIVCKAGNQDYSLDKHLKLDPPQSVDIGEKKLNISEFGLKRRYSAILPIACFWFLIKTVDWTKKYAPVHFTLLPLDTALAFFNDSKSLSTNLRSKIKILTEKWNNLNASRTLDDIRGLSEHIYLSAHDFGNSDGSKGRSQVVVTLSNWSWVQEVKERKEENVRCDQSNFTIGFKISSTTFQNINKTTDDCVHFDKQGVVIKYSDFFGLLKNAQFNQFISNVKKTFASSDNQNGLNHDDRPTPDEIYINHYGTGTQPMDLDETNRAYREEMTANGYEVPSFYISSSPLSSDNEGSSEKKVKKKSKAPLASGKRPSNLSTKETIKRLKQL